LELPNTGVNSFKRTLVTTPSALKFKICVLFTEYIYTFCVGLTINANLVYCKKSTKHINTLCGYIFYLSGIVANKHVSTQFKMNAVSGVDSAPKDLMEQVHKILKFLMDSLRVDTILLREDSVLSPSYEIWEEHY